MAGLKTADVAGIAAEYEVAYRQLKHLEEQNKKLEEKLQRDWQLAYARYQLARRAYLQLALDEDDAFLEDMDE